MPSIGVTPFAFLEKLHEIFLKYRVLRGANSQDVVILSCIVLVGQQGVTGGQTDTFVIAKTKHLHSKLC